MGYEFKLKAKLTEKQKSDIKSMLLNETIFDKKYEFDCKEILEFRNSENQSKLPNINIILENDGIYICQYGSSDLWTDLDKLKDFININKIEFDLIEY